MSDEPQQTYSDREIVLELFPATSKYLIPQQKYFFIKEQDGQIYLYQLSNADLNVKAQQIKVNPDTHKNHQALLTLTPINPAGKAATQLCCDFCKHTGSRQFLQIFRVSAPNSEGRRFLYVCLCRNTEACETRRLSDKPIQNLLARLKGD